MNFFCLCMSPAIDATISLKAWPRDGEVVKDIDEVETVGGKGVNVARVLALRGDTVVLGGLLGADNAAPFTREFGRHGIRDAFLRVPGLTRRNEMVTSPQGQFKLNRRAFPLLADTDWSPAAIMARMSGTGGADKPAACVLSGSLPPNVPASFYADFIATLRGAGIEAVLDTSGEALKRGVRARPAVIKPNTDECAELVGFAPSRDEEFIRAAGELTRLCPMAVISDGGNGCWFATRADRLRIWRATAPEVKVVDTTGAGDTLLAEFCHGFYARHLLTEEVMRRAVAAGSAAVTRPGAEPPEEAQIERLTGRVSIQEKQAMPSRA
jgi:1-phosphofructokinase